MHEVNRSLFLLIPLSPFWDWLSQLPQINLAHVSLASLQEDANAYLISVCENAGEAWAEIELRFAEIFAAELADWCEDETLWPDLTMENFTTWFGIQVASVVTDLSKQELMRESFLPLSLN